MRLWTVYISKQTYSWLPHLRLKCSVTTSNHFPSIPPQPVNRHSRHQHCSHTLKTVLWREFQKPREASDLFISEWVSHHICFSCPDWRTSNPLPPTSPQPHLHPDPVQTQHCPKPTATLLHTHPVSWETRLASIVSYPLTPSDRPTALRHPVSSMGKPRFLFAPSVLLPLVGAGLKKEKK